MCKIAAARLCATNKDLKVSNKFETVFSFPTVKYIALINRLKVYHIVGTSIAIPSCGILEVLNIIPNYIFLSASYIGELNALEN